MVPEPDLAVAAASAVHDGGIRRGTTRKRDLLDHAVRGVEVTPTVADGVAPPGGAFGTKLCALILDSTFSATALTEAGLGVPAMTNDHDGSM